MPDAETAARNQLLLHRFISGLPTHIGKQLCEMGEVNDLDRVLEWAKLLMTIEEPQKIAAVQTSEVQELREQVSILTEQVAALSIRQQSKRPATVVCYKCQQPGHLQRNCPLAKRCIYMGSWATLLERKLPWDVPEEAGASQELSPTKSAGIVAAAVQPSAAVTRGVLDSKEVNMMLDSGSSISRIEESVVVSLRTKTSTTPSSLKLVSAADKDIPTLRCITLPIQLGTLQVNHSLVIVRSLINPVILGLDFLHKHRIIIDFSSNPIKVSIPDTSDLNSEDFISLFDATRTSKAKICTIELLKAPTQEAIDDCVVPLFVDSLDNEYDMPSCVVPILLPLLQQYKSLFWTSPSSTTVVEHFIPTTGAPVKVPPRKIPAYYRLDVEKQIQIMLNEGIIEECSSPWLAPAVFVHKKTGDIRICILIKEQLRMLTYYLVLMRYKTTLLDLLFSLP